MKKTYYAIMLLLLLTVPLSLRSQDQEEFKPSGKLFGVFFADYHNTFSNGNNVSVFEVMRSFIGYDYSFSKTISSRIMFDAISQSVGGKNMLNGYLRNAYLQYDNGKFTLRGGLMESEQVSTASKFWNYRYIARPTIDASGMVIAADLGLIAKYKPVEQVVLDLGILNGRSYKDISPDTTFKLVSGITFTPAKNLMFRGYYDLMGPEGRRQWTMSLTGAYISDVFTLGAEYMRQNNHLKAEGEDYSGFTVFTAYRIKDKYSIFARYEKIGSVVLNGDADPWNINKDGNSFIIGMDYSPVKNIRIAPNFIGFIPDKENSHFTGTAGINVEAKF